MKKLTLFYLENCPYCHFARRALAELAAEDAKYAQIQVDWVEESRNPDLSSKYDYYYVPSVFDGSRKLYEASPSEDYEECRKNIRAALDACLE